MIETFQELIRGLAQKRADARLKLFDIKVKSLEGQELVLGGRVLAADDLHALTKALSKRYPSLRVDVNAPASSRNR